jgi:hypothetical protein
VNPHGGLHTEASKGTPRMKYVVAALAIALGIAGVVAGGAAVVLGVRMVQRSRQHQGFVGRGLSGLERLTFALPGRPVPQHIGDRGRALGVRHYLRRGGAEGSQVGSQTARSGQAEDPGLPRSERVGGGGGGAGHGHDERLRGGPRGQLG